MYLSYYLSILYADNASTDLLFSSQDIDLPLPGSKLWRPRWLRSAPRISGVLWRRTPIRRWWPRRIPTDCMLCILNTLDWCNFDNFMHFQSAFPHGSALRIQSSEISSMSSMISSQARNKSSKSSTRSLDTTGQQPHTTTTQHHVIMSWVLNVSCSGRCEAR